MERCDTTGQMRVGSDLVSGEQCCHGGRPPKLHGWTNATVEHKVRPYRTVGTALRLLVPCLRSTVVHTNALAIEHTP